MNTTQAQTHQSLWSMEFSLLFLISMFANTYIAVFYGFEYWLAENAIAPEWRGVLLAAMGIAVLCMRPVASIWLLRHKGIVLMACALLCNTAIMISYVYVSTPLAICLLRLGHGVCFAAMHSATVNMLVQCIPQGQSARAFGLFSLTMLLPFAIVPSVAELVLPYLPASVYLYSYTALLGIPALVCLGLLAWRLKEHPFELKSQSFSLKHIWQSMRHTGIGLLFLSSFLFGYGVVIVNFFTKSLCVQKGTTLGIFFVITCVMIMSTRLIMNKHIDKLPRPLSASCCALLMGASMLGFALAPTWALYPLAVLYGFALGLLYPLIAAFIYDTSTDETRSLNANTMMLTYDASNVFATLTGGVILNIGLSYISVFVHAAILVMSVVACIALFVRSHKKCENECEKGCEI